MYPLIEAQKASSQALASLSGIPDYPMFCSLDSLDRLAEILSGENFGASFQEYWEPIARHAEKHHCDSYDDSMRLLLGYLPPMLAPYDSLLFRLNHKPVRNRKFLVELGLVIDALEFLKQATMAMPVQPHKMHS